MLAQSFFSIDEFTGLIKYQLTLRTYLELFSPANMDIVLRTFLMAASVTLASALIAFPIAYYMARYAGGRVKALLYLAVMLPLCRRLWIIRSLEESGRRLLTIMIRRNAWISQIRENCCISPVWERQA